MLIYHPIVRTFCVVATVCSVISADVALADDFPEIHNTEPSDIQPMSPAEAAATMQLPDGFNATVFAAEPDVQNPIAMAWDNRGRLWIAENYTYSEQRFDLSLRDRVLIFEDTDNDGRADSRKVFTDQQQRLTSVEVGLGGVWLMCPPQLLFIPDADGDDVPDGPTQVVLDGFTIGESSYHNFANGLRWGPDGWLYGRCGHSCPGQIGAPGTPDEQRIPIVGGIWRYHPQRKTFEVLCHGTVNPWGHDWDANGELFFINTVIGHLWHCIPGSHFKESSGESRNPRVYERMDMIADHYHYDRNGSWSQSRDGKANDFGGGHAHVGMMIYNGQTWPADYHGKLMTINMHGRRVNPERLDRTTTGYVGRHEPDFLISQDPYFRGTDLSVGPDGNVYLIDWSDTGECHERSGVHRTSGRIFKISHKNTPQQSFAKPMCMVGDGPLPQLWKQYQAGQTTPAQLRDLLNDPNEHVRVWAIRLLTDHWPLDTLMGPISGAKYPVDQQTYDKFVTMARDDTSGLVIRLLTSTLQRLPLNQRTKLALAILGRDEFAGDHDLSLLMWYGLMPLADNSTSELVDIVSSNTWPHVNHWITRNFATHIESNPKPLNALLVTASETSPEAQAEVLYGLHEGLRGLSKADMPSAWKSFAASPDVKQYAALVRDLETVFGDGRALDELRKIVFDRRASQFTRRSALQTLINAEPNDMQAICERLLDDRSVNTVAVNGLAKIDDPQVAALLAQKHRRFQPQDRAKVIETLLSRKSSAAAMLDAIASGRSQIAVDDITAAHARQIQSFHDEQLTAKLSDVWGDLRETSADRASAIATWKAELTPQHLAKADVSAGRLIFKKSCAGCHVLFGDGQKVGPDLTGAQRSSLDYLLQNILDPSAVVSKDYRMSTIITTDGRLLNGLILSSDNRKTVLRTATEELTIPADEIDEVQDSNLSAMPDGLLKTMSPAQVRDVIAYLMHPTQVTLPTE